VPSPRGGPPRGNDGAGMGHLSSGSSSSSSSSSSSVYPTGAPHANSVHGGESVGGVDGSGGATASSPMTPRRTKSRRWSDPFSAMPDVAAINAAMGLPADYMHMQGAGQRGAAAPGLAGLGGSDGVSLTERSEGGEVPVRQVLKQGMLTKLSKGGFTANWNRRAFVLIGSTLYYAKDRATLNVQPKVFAEIYGCEARPFADDGHGHSNVFAIRLPVKDEDAPSENNFEMLLLAADTPREKFGWLDAVTQGSRMPPCPVSLVAPTLTLKNVYGGLQDGTLNSVLQAEADVTRGRVRPNGDRDRGLPVETHVGYQRRAPAASQDGSRDDENLFNLERWMPDFLKNV
jgi:hypothetical protein